MVPRRRNEKYEADGKQFRRLGQAVKTLPFHGSNMGSIPVGVTNILQSSQGGRDKPPQQIPQKHKISTIVE